MGDNQLKSNIWNEAGKAGMKATAESNMDKAVAFIVERIVNS